MPDLDFTHAPDARSWIESANVSSCDYPIQNLPFGVFKTSTCDDAHIGVAIGDLVLDVHKAIQNKLLGNISPETACALSASSLNCFMGLGPTQWTEARHAIFNLLHCDATIKDESLLVAQADAIMQLPSEIGDYTDFYASIHHATNVGSMFRPDNPLLPNYQYIPIGYHGRASSIVTTGTPVVRPHGQLIGADGPPPSFGPCRLLDYEMEMGVFVGKENPMGGRIDMEAAPSHLFGMVIVNDWSARDIQKWEYQPLGPFNAKNFVTTVSPWVVTMDALAPYMIDGPFRRPDDPAPLEYLKPAGPMGIDMAVEVSITSQDMREQGASPHRVSLGNFRDMYWTVAQMLVHHASGGCNMQPGDLFASGTISNEEKSSRGCLLEMTWRGEEPVSLPDGTERKFLQDGDEVIMKAWCEKEGAARIGFGDCRGIILGAS